MKRTLALAATLAAVLSSAPAQTPAEPPAKPIAFAVSTVKPSPIGPGRMGFMYSDSGLSIENIPFEDVIRSAYQLQAGQLLNVPDWAKTARFNIEAKVDEEDREALKKLPIADRMAMVRVLLADRFHLKTHPDTRELPVFNLVVAKGGSRLKPTEATTATKNHGIRMNRGEIHGTDCTLDLLTRILASLTHHLVVDQTGLTAHYDFDLTYTDENATASADNAAPSVYTALQEQLGLKLDSAKAPMPVVVIDQVDQPTAD